MKRILLLVLGGVIGVLIVFGVIGAISMSKMDIDDSPEGLLAFEMDIPKEVALPIQSAFESIGIDNVSSIKHDELLDNAFGNNEIGYRVSTFQVNNIILYLNADLSVYQIKYADFILYEDGKAKGKIEDYYLTADQRNKLIEDAQREIKRLLKSPSTAVFPEEKEWLVNKVEGVTTILGYVDAQNDFGAMLRSEFKFTVKDRTITSLIFDGNEYVGN